MAENEAQPFSYTYAILLLFEVMSTKVIGGHLVPLTNHCPQIHTSTTSCQISCLWFLDNSQDSFSLVNYFNHRFHILVVLTMVKLLIIFLNKWSGSLTIKGLIIDWWLINCFISIVTFVCLFLCRKMQSCSRRTRKQECGPIM